MIRFLKAPTTLEQALKRINDLEAAIDIALEFVDSYTDVVDSPDGGVEPNHAAFVESELLDARYGKEW